jgi:hypothetical protein
MAIGHSAKLDFATCDCPLTAKKQTLGWTFGQTAGRPLLGPLRSLDKPAVRMVFIGSHRVESERCRHEGAP